MATPMTVNFSLVQDLRQHPIGNSQDNLPPKAKPRDADGKLLTPKQIRARARRKAARSQIMTAQEVQFLYPQKPIDEWDLDELAHGRPRNEKGHFKGPNPKWISAQVHEEAMEKYTAAVKMEMRSTTVDALGLLRELINDDNVDEKGKPLVPASVKLEASKFLLEHVVGKPTQRIESDVSIKLQGILGQVLVNPADINNNMASGRNPHDDSYTLGHFPGITMELAEALDDDYID